MLACAACGIGIWLPTCLYLPLHGAYGQLHAYRLMAGSDCLCGLCWHAVPPPAEASH